MFGILRQGMRDKHCYELYARRGVFHTILAFFSSPLCDDEAQVGGPRGLFENERSVLLLTLLSGSQTRVNSNPSLDVTNPLV